MTFSLALCWLAASVLVGVLAGILILHLLPRLGSAGRRLSAALARAPGLDLVLVYLLQLPQAAGLVAGWSLASARAINPWLGALAGLGVSLLAQAVALVLWMRAHEAWHSRLRPRPHTIKRALRDVLGGGFSAHARNSVAVWWTALAIHVFFLIRVAQYVVYPVLVWLVRLPRLNHAAYVNVSRQKFAGLVGSDRVWCLYCDWMTGLWSLGSEMLRNLESFWCPIRFASPEKCARCTLDFPDVAASWVPASGTMAEVDAVLRAHYPGPNNENSWHAAPVPLSVRGREPRPGSTSAPPSSEAHR